MELTRGWRSDLGREYRHKVITYVAANLTLNPSIKDFVIYSKLSKIGEFDDLILKLWFESEIAPYVYLFKTRHKSGRPIKISDSIIKYANSFNKLMLNKKNIDIFQDVPDDNIKFWFFCNNDVEENLRTHNESMSLYDVMQLDHVSELIIPIKFLMCSCYQIRSSEVQTHADFLGKLYLFLKQPNVYEMVEKIAKISGIADSTNIIDYVDDYYKESQLLRCGLTKTNFEIELLKIHLKDNIVKPTEIVDVNEEQAHIWNKLTTEHQITIVDHIDNIRRVLFGCFVQKINDLFNHTLRWNDCLHNQGQLDSIIIEKFEAFSKNNTFKQWVSRPDNIKSLIECLWICNELPLILRMYGPLPILVKYKHLNKRFLIICESTEYSEAISSSFSQVFTTIASIHTDSLRDEVLENITVSLQGRSPVPLKNIVGRDEDCISRLKSSQILHLIRKRKMYLKESCLDEAESTIFIIEDENLHTEKSTSEVDADENDTIIINCKPSEAEWYIERIKGNPDYNQHSICHLRSIHRKLEFLQGDRYALRTFFIDEWGDDLYCTETDRPIAIIGRRLDKKPQIYIPRYLRKAIIPNSVFKTQGKLICLLSGDIDSLDSDVKKQLTKEDIDYNIKIKLENNKNVLIDEKMQCVSEYWNKFSSLGYPLFHVKVVEGCMELLNYRNCNDMSSYISYSKEAFPETAFFEEISSQITVISGEPGVGKSSILRSLSEANNENNYVLFCNLADYRHDLATDNNKLFEDPLDYIFNKFEGPLCKELVRCLFKYHKNGGRLTLFIDSFDEILPMQRKSVLLFMNAVAKFNIRVIVASRLYFDTLLINNLQVQPVEVDNLKENDYAMYFKNKGMLNMNLNDVPIEFLQSPLFLTFLWFLHREGLLDFSKIGKFDLYKRIIQKKIERYYRKSKQIYNPEAKGLTNDVLRLHRLIALVAVFGKDIVMQQKIVKNYERLIRDFKVLKMRLGIVKHFNCDFAIFLHQTFAEYLAAEWLCEKLLDDDFDLPAQIIYKKMVIEHDANIRYLFDSMICANLNLHKAILEGNLNLTRQLTNEQDSNLTTVDKCGRNALLLATSHCFDKNYQILEEVVSKSHASKVDFLKRDNLLNWNWYECLDVLSKETFFDRACNYNLPVTVTKYLTCRERLIAPNNLLNAYQNGNLDIILALFASNPTLLIEPFFFYETTKKAIEKGRLDIAYCLIELRFECNIIDAFRNIQSVLYLKEFVQTKTQNQFTALHLACMIGNPKLVKELLKDSLYDSTQDVFGNTSLNYAIIEGNVEIAYLLIDDADWNLVNKVNKEGDTTLHFVCRHLRDEFIAFVFSEEININAKNIRGETALHAVACINWQQITEKEARGISNRFKIKYVNEKERNFNSILMLPHSSNQSNHLIEDVLKAKVIALIDTLLSFGSEIKEQDKDGNTALHLAYKHNNKIFLEYLIKKSEEIAFTKNANGFSVFEIAQREKKIDLVDYIQQHSSKTFQDTHISNSSILLSESEESSIRSELRFTGEKGRSLLHTAVINGRSDIIQLLVQKGFPIDVQDNEGCTPLHLVKSECDAKLLLNKCINLNDALKKSRNSETPLCTACRNGYIDVVRLLLEQYNSDVNTRNEQGQTPLHLAATSNHLEVGILLLEMGADINGVDSNNTTTLHLVVSEGNISFVEFLLENNANTASQDFSGNTALHLACRYGHTKLVERLIKQSPEFVCIRNAEGYRPYDVACLEGKRDVVEIFMKKNSSKRALTISADILFKIVEMGHSFILNMLWKENIFTQDQVECKDENCNTLLHLAASRNLIDVMQLFLEKGFKPNPRNNSHETPLHLVKSVECTKMLLSKYNSRLNPHSKTKLNETPLHFASSVNRYIVQILLNAGADISSKDIFGWTPLHVATWANKADIVELLIENGANINEINNYSGTALHIAASQQLPVFKLLLNSGADINAVKKGCGLALQRNIPYWSDLVEEGQVGNYNNQTVLDIACTYGKDDIIEFLLKRINRIKWPSISEEALYEIVSRGDLWCLKMLFDKEIIKQDCLQCTDSNGDTPLHIAVMYGYDDMVSFLISNGAKVNVKNENEMTPITLALLKRHTAILNTILASDEQFNFEENLNFVETVVIKNDSKCLDFILNARIVAETRAELLCLAVSKGSLALLDMLMINEIDFNERSRDGCTVFEFLLLNLDSDRIRHFLSRYPLLKECSISSKTLFELVKEGKKKSLEILCENDILRNNVLNYIDNNGSAHLHLATTMGLSDVIQQLLEKGVTADVHDALGYSPLHLAIISPIDECHKRLHMVQMFLSAKADVSIQDIDGNTPLHYAAKQNYTDIVRLLIENGACVNAVNNDFKTALHIAASHGLPSTVEILLQHGANFKLQDRRKNTPLHLACTKGHKDVVKLLLSLSNDLLFLRNIDNYIPFEFVCISGTYEQIKSILTNWNKSNDYIISSSILFDIIDRGELNALKALFEEAVLTQNDLERTNQEGDTPLYVAVAKRKADIVRILLENGANVNITNLESMTLLHVAASENLLLILEMLLEFKADTNLVDKNGNTPLHFAYMKGNLEVIKLLIKSSHKIGSMRNLEGYTPFEFACVYGTNAVVETLLDHIPSTRKEEVSSAVLRHILETDRLMALHLVLVNGSDSLLEMLLTDEIDFCLKDEKGHNVLEYICLKANGPRIKYLLCKYNRLKHCCISNDTLFHLVETGELVSLQTLFDEHVLTQNSLEVTDDEGRTCLHKATIRKHSHVIKFLLSKGSSLDRCDSQGYTPLHFVKSVKDVRLLTNEQNSATVNARTYTGLTPLHLASRDCHVDIVQALLISKADIRSQDQNGDTPLHFATKADHIDTVCLLLRGGADIDATNNYSQSALHVAVSTNRLSIVEILFRNGADVELQDNRKNTPLHLACKQSHVHIFELLLDLSSKIFFSKNLDNCTPFELLCINGMHDQIKVLLSYCNKSKENIISSNTLFEIVSRGNSKILQILFEENILSQTHLGYINRKGDTPLHSAVIKGEVDVVRTLLENGANANVTNMQSLTALHIAVSKNILSILPLLLHYKADVGSVDENGNTPLHLAYLKCNIHAIGHLIKYFDNISLIKNNEGYNPFEFACMRAESGILKSLLDYISSAKGEVSSDTVDREDDLGIKYPTGKYLCLEQCNISNTTVFRLIEEGRCMSLRTLFDRSILSESILESTDNKGRTLLHKAALLKLSEIVQLLLEKGAAILRYDDRGYTPLHLTDSTKVIELLISKQEPAIINARSHTGVTPLHLASCNGSLGAVEMLLRAKANISSRDKNGDTPLHFAVRRKHINIIQCLIANGAKINESNNSSSTALHIAVSNNLVSIVELLLQNGADIELEDKNRNTALHLACRKNNKDLVKILLNLSDEISFSKNSDNSLSFKWCFINGPQSVENIIKICAMHKEIVLSKDTIFQVVENGDFEVVQVLFEENILTEDHLKYIDKDGNTPLHLAVRKKREPIIEILLENGADVNAINQINDGMTALHIAVLYTFNSSSIVELLLAYRANTRSLNSYGQTPLHLACTGENIDVIRVLIIHSNEVMLMKDQDGYTPFELVCMVGIDDILNIFIDHLPTVKEKEIFANALYSIVDKGQFISLKLLLRKHIINEEDLKNTCQNGRSLLHIATINNDVDIVRFLLSKGVNVNPADADGFRPLHLAKSANVAEVLLAGYANILDAHEKTQSGRTPLHTASLNGHVEVIQLLVSVNADVSAKDICGWTPLLLAAYMNQNLCVKILLNSGADVNEMNNCNETALHLSAQNGNWNMVYTFLENGGNVLIKDSNGDMALHSIMKLIRWYSWFIESPLYNSFLPSSNIIDLVNTLREKCAGSNGVNEEEESAMGIVEELKLEKLPILKYVPEKYT